MTCCWFINAVLALSTLISHDMPSVALGHPGCVQCLLLIGMLVEYQAAVELHAGMSLHQDALVTCLKQAVHSAKCLSTRVQQSRVSNSQ
jgi:hypothetical protein